MTRKGFPQGGALLSKGSNPTAIIPKVIKPSGDLGRTLARLGRPSDTLTLTGVLILSSSEDSEKKERESF